MSDHEHQHQHVGVERQRTDEIAGDVAQLQADRQVRGGVVHMQQAFGYAERGGRGHNRVAHIHHDHGKACGWADQRLRHRQAEGAEVEPRGVEHLERAIARFVAMRAQEHHEQRDER